MMRRGRQAPAARPTRPAALRPGARPGGGMRRTRPIRRASAGLTPVRAGALLALLGGIAAIYGLAASGAFAAHRAVVTGATWTSEKQILATLDVADGTNLFTLRTDVLEARLKAIPAIRSVHVTVALPDQVQVAVVEREALVAWKVGERRFLVDGEGSFFAQLGADAPAAAKALPVIDDSRYSAMAYAVGSTLDAVTLDAALRLGSLKPSDVGSGAKALVLRIDDVNGFTMRTRPATWTAIFGFYTPTLRTTELIPGQVRLLRSLLAGQEGNVARVILADDVSGTFIPKETPKPTKSPRPGATPKPTKSPRPAGTATAKPSATARPSKTPKPTAKPTPTPSPRP
jgi:cell division septal protein FtsQ